MKDKPGSNVPVSGITVWKEKDSVLKRCHELNRCRDHGQDGFEKWVGWGVIAANLKTIGRKVAAKT